KAHACPNSCPRVDHAATWLRRCLGQIGGVELAKTTRYLAQMHLQIQKLITHDDKVIARFTNGGTNVGPFLNNPPAIEPLKAPLLSKVPRLPPCQVMSSDHVFDGPVRCRASALRRRSNPVSGTYTVHPAAAKRDSKVFHPTLGGDVLPCTPRASASKTTQTTGARPSNSPSPASVS